MANQSANVILLLVILSVMSVPVNLEPIFGKYYCDMFCADYDDDSSSSESSEDFFDIFFDPCVFCPSKPTKPNTSRGSTTTTTNNPLQQLPFNFQFPPMGLNMTMGKTGNSWFLNFWPFNGGFSGSSAPAPGAPAATPAGAPAKPAPANASTPANATKPAAG